MFIILYPLGAYTEVSTLYNSIPYFNRITSLHFTFQGTKITPEEWIQWYLYLYILGIHTMTKSSLLGFPYLYYHMFKQRSKHLKNKQD